MKFSQAIALLFLQLAALHSEAAGLRKGVTDTVAYYIDADKGDDKNNGRSASQAWQTIQQVESVALLPGNVIKFKRGSLFVGPLYIRYSGTADQRIVITDYGDSSASAPLFTNPAFRAGNFGNCIRVQGSYVTVEKMHCQYTAAYRYGPYTLRRPVWDTTVWEMGAIYIDKQAAHCIVKDNEIEDCVVGIKSYGPYALITHNYLHDCNRVLKEWGWGPIGIWFGGDYQEASYNLVFNYRAEDPRIGWPPSGGGGADGGAFEIDDARYDKTHISIHHNYTRDCQGFLEVTWTDIKQMPLYKGFEIHHNISDDYQQFLALWDARECNIYNNTIIRRKKNVSDWGVFNIAQDNSFNHISNNIIITEQDIQIYNTGLRLKRNPKSVIDHNLYYAAAGKLVIGDEGPGEAAITADPMLDNYRYGRKSADFMPQKGSPATNPGTIGANEPLP